MTYEDHLDDNRAPDGEFDLAAAEAARAAELAADPESLKDLAAKAARAERRAWESKNRDALSDQMDKHGQQELDLDGIDLTVLVPLGDNAAVELGDMNRRRIRIRVDMRTRTHIRELRAFDREITFWQGVDPKLPADDDEGTIRDIDT